MVIGAAAWWLAMRSRMSRFQARRSICQAPSDSANRKIGSIMRVGHSNGFSLSIEPLETGLAKTNRRGSPGGSDDRRFAASVQGDGRVARSPPVDAEEQEQPDHVDEVPVPGGRLEAEMLVGREVAYPGTDQADQQEDGADDDVKAMEP